MGHITSYSQGGRMADFDKDEYTERTAKRIVVSNHDTDHATGHTECSECGGAIDFWDRWCRHCGARLEDS